MFPLSLLKVKRVRQEQYLNVSDGSQRHTESDRKTENRDYSIAQRSYARNLTSLA